MFVLGKLFQPWLTNTLAWYKNLKSQGLKKYYNIGPRNHFKTFLSVIHQFSCQARVLVRLGCKSLPRSNTLAYYENLKIRDKKVFFIKTLAQVNRKIMNNNPMHNAEHVFTLKCYWVSNFWKDGICTKFNFMLMI